MSGRWQTNRVAPLPPGWQRTRARIIARDASTCQQCGSHTSKPEVDHIGDRNDHRDSNLRVLCPACHAKRTSAQGVAALKARARRRFIDPEPHPGEVH